MSDQHDTDGGQPISHEDRTRWLQELRADMAASVNGSLLRGARPVQVGNVTTGGIPTLRPTMSAGCLVGYCFASEPGTAPGLVRIKDRDNNLIAIAPIGGGNADAVYSTAWFGPGGINIPDGGIYLECPEDFDGVVYLRGTD